MLLRMWRLVYVNEKCEIINPTQNNGYPMDVSWNLKEKYVRKE